MSLNGLIALPGTNQLRQKQDKIMIKSQFAAEQITIIVK